MDGIVRVRTIAFTPDRMPMLRRIRLGYEGDNLVERLEFDLPEIVQGQTATLMITGVADAVKLKRTDEGRYAVDLTRDMIGPDGEREAYIRIDGVGGEVWQSAVMRMVTGALPDVEEEIEKVYPTAVGQMLTAMAEHSSEMQAQEERVEQAAQRAEEAAERAEAGGGGGGSGGSTVEIDATLTQAGKAADAKATGDRISQLSKEIENLKESEGGGDSNLTTGQYDVAAYVRNGKPSYVLVPHGENVSLHPVDVYADSGLSANNLYYFKEQFAQSGQDGAFAHDKIFRLNESGTARITDAVNGTLLQTMELDKKDLIMPHANSVSIVQGETSQQNLELTFTSGKSYDSSSGNMINNDRACTEIFALAEYSGLAFSVTSCRFIISCYDAGGTYMGQIKSSLDGLVKGSGQWLSAGTQITVGLINSASGEIAKIAIIAEDSDLSELEYTGTYGKATLWLYANIYNNYASDADRHLGECCVYLVEYDGTTYSNTLSHILKIGFTGNQSLWVPSTAIRPYGNFVVDGEHGKLYAYVSDWTGIQKTRWHEFELPSAEAGVMNEEYGCPVVTLTASDIKNSWNTKHQIYPQGGCCHDGKVWCASGFGTSAALRNLISVYDVEQQQLIAELDVQAAGLTDEAEFIDFRDGVLYYGTISKMYKFTLC